MQPDEPTVRRVERNSLKKRIKILFTKWRSRTQRLNVEDAKNLPRIDTRPTGPNETYYGRPKLPHEPIKNPNQLLSFGQYYGDNYNDK